jgi:hypothetical protein
VPICHALLDFAKAYDQVEHAFIWDLLAAMGFCPDFRALVQGLITGSAANVHFNGLFTGRFVLERGVKQGCPLAPLLFALSTQPVMLILKDHLQAGTVKGIKINDAERMLFQLFAEDTGLFFMPLSLIVKL